MAIVCIKIGENEKPTYAKFDKLSRHLDIIDVLPRKKDKDGKPISRGMGLQAEKEYLGIDVDMDELTDEEFEFTRNLLVEKGVDSKRLNKVVLSVLGVDQKTVDEINTCADKRRNKESYDLSAINRELQKTKIPLKSLLDGVVEKTESKTLSIRLDLGVKSAKVAIQQKLQAVKNIEVK